MPIDEVLISSLAGGRCAAGRERGVLVALAFGDAVIEAGAEAAACGDTGDLRLGDVYLGRVHRRVPSVGGMFVTIGPGRPGLMMDADAPGGRRPADGETVVVQVVRTADADKGPKLTGRLADPGVAGDGGGGSGTGPVPRCLVRGPDAVEVLLQRADREGALRRIVVDDPAVLVRLRTLSPARAPLLQPWHRQVPLFEAEGVSEAIEAALSCRVPLAGGGRLIIEETAALVAIDVDLGTLAGPSARAAALACNLQAATAIGREVRLRDLAGRIVVDFIPLRRPAERAQILNALRAALDDGDRTLTLGGWTKLGLVEVTREKRGPSLAARLLRACPACEGSGRVLAPARPTGAPQPANLALSPEER